MATMDEDYIGIENEIDNLHDAIADRDRRIVALANTLRDFVDFIEQTGTDAQRPSGYVAMLVRAQHALNDRDPDETAAELETLSAEKEEGSE